MLAFLNIVKTTVFCFFFSHPPDFFSHFMLQTKKKKKIFQRVVKYAAFFVDAQFLECTTWFTWNHILKFIKVTSLLFYLFCQMASSCRRINNFVIKNGKIERQAEPYWMRGLHLCLGYVKGLLVRFLRVFHHCCNAIGLITWNF